MLLNPSEPKVSVLLSVYNGGRYLRESLESVLAQSMTDFELLAVDDGSSDDSVSILRSIRDDRLQFSTNESNIGLFRNLNHLVKRSRAPLVKLWSQDDIMLTPCLETGLRFYEKYPDIGCFWCANETIDEHARLVSAKQHDETPEILDPDTANLYAMHHGCLSANISSLFIPTQRLIDAGLFDSHYISADFEFMVRIQEKNRIGHISDPLIRLRNHPDQWSLAEDSLIWFLSDSLKIYDVLRNRLVKSNTLQTEEIHDVLCKKFGENYFHAAIKCLLTGRITTAIGIIRQLSNHLPVRQVCGAWLRSLFYRMRKRLA